VLVYTPVFGECDTSGRYADVRELSCCRLRITRQRTVFFLSGELRGFGDKTWGRSLPLQMPALPTTHVLDNWTDSNVGIIEANIGMVSFFRSVFIFNTSAGSQVDHRSMLLKTRTCILILLLICHI
jgi:hypothetical protein